MPDRKVFKDYREEDIQNAFEQGEPSCWYDLIRYLERRGLDLLTVSPGECAHMIADAKQAMKDNVPFAFHSEQAFRVMKSHRNPELVRQEEQRWIEWAAKAPPLQSRGGKAHAA